ncbi:MAG: peptidoglycan-binding protein [Chloroflexi bacterium]|nr:peptidoglycan-binding protein [Chloroflexota bacterium]
MAVLLNSAYLNETASTLPNRRSPAYIQWVQQSLNRILEANLAVDGKIGPKTRKAIQDFQRQKGLKVDGSVGPVAIRARPT